MDVCNEDFKEGMLETCLSLKYLVFLSCRPKNTGKASSNKEAFVLKLNLVGVLHDFEFNII